MRISSSTWLAVATAGISAFMLGGVWYSPALFGKAWMKENNLSVEEVQKGNKTKIFAWAFILSLVMSANLAMFLNDPKINLELGIIYGLLTGLGYSAELPL